MTPGADLRSCRVEAETLGHISDALTTAVTVHDVKEASRIH